MKMKSSSKLLFFALCCFVLTTLKGTTLNTSNYLTFHYDIKIAMEEEDYKRAKYLVQTLIPMVDSDIEFTEAAIADEEDEYIINSLTSKVRRQREIRKTLDEFLGEKKKNLTEFNSLDVIRELRRLSVKPKER